MSDRRNLLTQVAAELDKRSPNRGGGIRFLMITQDPGKHPEIKTLGPQEVPPSKGCRTYTMILTAGADAPKPKAEPAAAPLPLLVM